MQQFGGMAGP